MGRSGAWAATLSLLAASLTAATSGAQRASTGDEVTPRARSGRAVDSTGVLRSARSAQAEFERLRARHSPRVRAGYTHGCDERIGRFCLTHDDDTTDAVPVEPPAEHPQVTAGRRKLLDRLDSAARLIPGDDWVHAQVIRYELEADRDAEALARARACAPSRWWCAAVAGFALHLTGDFAAADSAFTAALAAMPEEQRCDWIDLRQILEGDALDGYRKLSCEARVALNERLWWLADPLHGRAGNDRRTEHYARLTFHEAQDRATTAQRLRWGNDDGEITIRYGIETHWAQLWPRPGEMGAPAVIAYRRTPGYRFLPEATALDLRTARDDAWTLRPAQAQARYSPLYATFAPLSHQVAVFPRGDSMLVVAAYDAGADSLLDGDTTLVASLVVGDGPGPLDSAAVWRQGAPGRGSVALRAAYSAQVASLELVGRRRARRARLAVAIDAPNARLVRMSDVAFFTPGDSLPRTVEALRALMRPDPTAARDERLGLYWEISGPIRSTATLTTRIAIVREGASWLRRAGERIGLLDAERGVQIGWDDSAAGEAGIVARAVIVDLTGLDPGRYRIEVSIEGPTGPPMIATRALRIIR